MNFFNRKPLDDLDAKRRYYLAELEAKFKLLVEQLETLTPENLEILYRVCSEYNDIIETISGKLDLLDGLLANGETDNALTAQVQALEKGLALLDKHKVSATTFTQTINQLRAQISASGGNVTITPGTGNSNPGADYSARIAAIEQEIYNLKNNLPSVDLSSIDSKISAIEQTIDVIRGSIPSLDEPIESIESLQSRCTTLESLVETLQSRCKTLEAGLNNLSPSSDVTFNSVTANRVTGVVYT